MAIFACLGASVGALEIYVFRDLSEPVTAAMKREGCLWEPDWIERSALLLLIPLYSAIFFVALNRQVFPKRTQAM